MEKFKDPAPIAATYVEDRMLRYQAVLDDIASRKTAADDRYGIACRMWNRSLFFEFHKWLEIPWHRAAGGERKMLQAYLGP